MSSHQDEEEEDNKDVEKEEEEDEATICLLLNWLLRAHADIIDNVRGAIFSLSFYFLLSKSYPSNFFMPAALTFLQIYLLGLFKVKRLLSLKELVLITFSNRSYVNIH